MVAGRASASPVLCPGLTNTNLITRSFAVRPESVDSGIDPNSPHRRISVVFPHSVIRSAGAGCRERADFIITTMTAGHYPDAPTDSLARPGCTCCALRFNLATRMIYRSCGLASEQMTQPQGEAVDVINLLLLIAAGACSVIRLHRDGSSDVWHIAAGRQALWCRPAAMDGYWSFTAPMAGLAQPRKLLSALLYYGGEVPGAFPEPGLLEVAGDCRALSCSWSRWRNGGAGGAGVPPVLPLPMRRSSWMCAPICTPCWASACCYCRLCKGRDAPAWLMALVFYCL